MDGYIHPIYYLKNSFIFKCFVRTFHSFPFQKYASTHFCHNSSGIPECVNSFNILLVLSDGKILETPFIAHSYQNIFDWRECFFLFYVINATKRDSLHAPSTLCLTAYKKLHYWTKINLFLFS